MLEIPRSTRIVLGLTAVSLLFTACRSRPVSPTPASTEASAVTFPLPPGLTPDMLTAIPTEQSGQLIAGASEFFENTGCVFPPVVLYRVPTVHIAPGVVRDAFVIPGKTPQDPMKIGLISHQDLPVDQATIQDILDVAHEFIHLCNSKDSKLADRSKPLFSYTDESWGITTTVYPTTRYTNPGLTTDIIASSTSGEQQVMPGAGSLEELFAHTILDYLIETKGKTDLLAKERINNPIQPGINFVRNALATNVQMQDAVKMMQTDDAKGAFDLLYGAMLTRGLNDGLTTMQDGGSREQEMKFFFFLMLMRISNISAPYAVDTINYEQDVKNQMSQMFYENGKTYDSLTEEQGTKIDTIFKDMFLTTPTTPSSSRMRTSHPQQAFLPNVPLWDRRSMLGQSRRLKTHRV